MGVLRPNKSVLGFARARRTAVNLHVQNLLLPVVSVPAGTMLDFTRNVSCGTLNEAK